MPMANSLLELSYLEEHIKRTLIFKVHYLISDMRFLLKIGNMSLFLFLIRL